MYIFLGRIVLTEVIKGGLDRRREGTAPRVWPDHFQPVNSIIARNVTGTLPFLKHIVSRVVKYLLCPRQACVCTHTRVGIVNVKCFRVLPSKITFL